MKSHLTEEINRTMTEFLNTSSDEEFWATLEEAGWSVFSEVDVPILSYLAQRNVKDGTNHN